jgi:hypothetical protein
MDETVLWVKVYSCCGGWLSTPLLTKTDKVVLQHGRDGAVRRACSVALCQEQIWPREDQLDRPQVTPVASATVVFAVVVVVVVVVLLVRVDDFPFILAIAFFFLFSLRFPHSSSRILSFK